MTTTTRKIVLTAIRRDGSSEIMYGRTLTKGEEVNLYDEAKTALDQRSESEWLSERSMSRNERPRTMSVQADLKVNGQLVDRDEASCLV